MSFGKKCLATIVFWATLLLGPVALALINALAFYSMRPGELLYLLYALAAQGIAAGVACYLANRVVQNEGDTQVVRTNAAIALLFLVLLALFHLMAGAILDVISYLGAIGALYFCGISQKNT